MKIKSTIFAITVAFTTSYTFATEYIPTFAEHVAILGVMGQTFSKMDYDRKQFIKNDRPYTFEEDTDYLCNAILAAKDNIKLANKYPQYIHDVHVKNYVKENQGLINTLQQGLVKENRKCKGHVVGMPATTKGTIPLIMSNNEANQKYAEYYSKREEIVDSYKNASDPASKRKQICALKDLSVTTEMYILLYPSMSKSEEGQKILSIIKSDSDYMRTKLSMDEKCGI